MRFISSLLFARKTPEAFIFFSKKFVFYSCASKPKSYICPQKPPYVNTEGGGGMENFHPNSVLLTPEGSKFFRSLLR